MTDERDPAISEAVSQHYRELGAEEPSRALDDAIIAAARREAGAGPTALSARSGRQRWYAPLATAAVLVLAVAVTLNLQVERPGIESPVQQAAAPRSDEPAVEPSSPVAEAQEVKIPRRKAAEQPAPSVAAAPAVPAAPEPKPFAADQAAAPMSARSDESRGAASGVTGTLARQVEERTSRDAEAAARAPQVGPVQALKQADTPERELERIAELRAQGRHDEADRALAEFRKRYRDYRIPEAMRERVERR